MPFALIVLSGDSPRAAFCRPRRRRACFPAGRRRDAHHPPRPPALPWRPTSPPPHARPRVVGHALRHAAGRDDGRCARLRRAVVAFQRVPADPGWCRVRRCSPWCATASPLWKQEPRRPPSTAPITETPHWGRRLARIQDPGPVDPPAHHHRPRHHGGCRCRTSCWNPMAGRSCTSRSGQTTSLTALLAGGGLAGLAFGRRRARPGRGPRTAPRRSHCSPASPLSPR